MLWTPTSNWADPPCRATLYDMWKEHHERFNIYERNHNLGSMVYADAYYGEPRGMNALIRKYTFNGIFFVFDTKGECA